MTVPVGQALTDLAESDPKRPVIVCRDDAVTARELEQRANRLARDYAEMGVDEGSFVTIALPNGIEFFEALFAVWKLGAVPQPVSWALPHAERQAIIELAESALVVGVTDGVHPGRRSVPQGYRPAASISDAPIEPARTPPALKAPTSGGSTGRPKLIVSGQAGVIDPTAALASGMQVDGVVLVPGPLYHNAPLTTAVTGLLAGCQLVVLPKFDAEEALLGIERYRVDWVNLVPTMMLRMYRVIERDPNRFDLSSLRFVWHMAAPCPAWLKERWIELLGPERLMELYGTTEGQAMTAISGTEWLEHRGSVGRPMFGEIAILGADGNELPAGEVGEIFMRGPEGSAPSYRYIGAEAHVVGGWESVGDLGWKDAEGYLYISDRRTDLIISGGANIYPAEVESALMEHPAVQTCVVVGLPHGELGQRVHALVQGDPDEVSEQALLDFLTDRLVRYKIPRSIRLVNEMLRDDAGKVRRSALRDQEAALLA